MTDWRCLSPRQVALALFVCLAGCDPTDPGRRTTTTDVGHDWADNDLSDYLPFNDKLLSADGGFASSSRCRACHPSEYESWHDSFHRTMTQVASDASVQAPWDDVHLELGGESYRLFRERGRYYVQLPAGRSAGVEDVIRPVVMTTGSHNMQYYWMAAPWADEANLSDAEAGALTFAEFCSSCHGDESARRLDGAELTGGDIQLAFRQADHVRITADLSAERLEELTTFLQRIQSPGRITLIPFVYFVREQRWVSESNTFLHPETKASEHEGEGRYWSRNCDQCHTTAPEYTWSRQQLLGQTELAELGISCEACHGPARRHAARFSNPLVRYRRHSEADERAEAAPLDDIVNPARLDHRAASDVCGQCHSEAIPNNVTSSFRPGDRLSDSVNVIQLADEPYPPWLVDALDEEPDLFRDVFWPDGTIRIAGRDYNALVISECFAKGEMSCLSCHSMHGGDRVDQLSVSGSGDGACLACHTTMVGSVASHTNHPLGSTGSRCVNCHMPHTSWGLLKAVRAHRIDSPRAQTSLDTGRPNACNLCHLRATLPEVAHTLSEWYGQPAVDFSSLSQQERETAASLVWLLKGDAVQRAIVAWHMGWQPALAADGGTWEMPFLAQLLDDPYAAVRFVSGQSLSRLSGLERLRYDFEGPPYHWSSTSRAVVSRWLQTQAPDNSKLLLPGGRLDVAAMRRLLAQRDDTAILVAE